MTKREKLDFAIERFLADYNGLELSDGFVAKARRETRKASVPRWADIIAETGDDSIRFHVVDEDGLKVSGENLPYADIFCQELVDWYEDQYQTYIASDTKG